MPASFIATVNCTQCKRLHTPTLRAHNMSSSYFPSAFNSLCCENKPEEENRSKHLTSRCRASRLRPGNSEHRTTPQKVLQKSTAKEATPEDCHHKVVYYQGNAQARKSKRSGKSGSLESPTTPTKHSKHRTSPQRVLLKSAVKEQHRKTAIIIAKEGSKVVKTCLPSWEY
jgi:hypothetical protein